MKVLYPLLATLLLANCKTSEPREESETRLANVPSPLDYSPALNSALNQEYVPPGEANMLEIFALDFKRVHRKQQKQNQEQNNPQNNLRGMHAKGHGCAQAEFSGGPTEVPFQVGIFADRTPRKAVIRFSNGSGLIESDRARDLRGMAVKIYLPGLKQVSGAIEADVHDLLATNAPVHHAANIEELMDFTRAMADGGIWKASFLSLHPRLTSRLLFQTQRRVESVLNESYWSRAPFSFGQNRTFKYVIKPLQQLPALNEIDLESGTWLADDLAQQVKRREKITFGVYGQFQTDPVAEPIEDHATEWKTAHIKLGELVIKNQIVDTSATCENLVFNPWNAAQEHRPLGNMNRARKAIYETAKAYRLERPAN